MSPKMKDGSWHIPSGFKPGEPADIRCIPDLVTRRAKTKPRSPIAERQTSLGHTWTTVTAGDFQAEIERIASGLIGLGLIPGDRVAIMAATSYDWSLLDLAIMSAGLVVVPIYETSSAEQVEWIVRDARVKAAVTDTSAQANLIEACRGTCPALGAVVSMDSGGLKELAAIALDVPATILAERRRELNWDTLATIIYTSGTTGRPKGVELTHGNLGRIAIECIKEFPEVVDHNKCRVLMFLPLAHVLARSVTYMVLGGQGVIGFTPNIKNLLGDISTFKPSAILVVPRVLEKIYNAADAKASRGLKLRIFRWSANKAVKYSLAKDRRFGPGPLIGIKMFFARRLVLNKITTLLGGNCQYAVCGGAPLNPRLGHFFRGLGMTVLEGYGLTESTGPFTINRLKKIKIGSVGLPLPGCAIKIAPDGEVLAKGIGVFRGYNDAPQDTAEVFHDGWLYTGDLGRLDDDGRLYITGRKKEIIVTAGGKNVSPAPLEDQLRGHPLISQVLVVGDNRPYISALITLDADMLPLWLRNRGLPSMGTSAAGLDEQVLAALQRAIDRTNRTVSKAESIRRFVVLPTDFTEENGLLTPSLKVRREEALQRFAGQIDLLYGEESKQI